MNLEYVLFGVLKVRKLSTQHGHDTLDCAVLRTISAVERSISALMISVDSRPVAVYSRKAALHSTHPRMTIHLRSDFSLS